MVTPADGFPLYYTQIELLIHSPFISSRLLGVQGAVPQVLRVAVPVISLTHDLIQFIESSYIHGGVT
ncbi:hypothetical protein GDO81_022337 [Engystomops pustulosus]|uniref:Uncharacterized protein n=1 Tax=Engystomops pustulosus TaxID=76066 RepID=A0AAV6YMD6_ENGPU|nr:hypothetical protein GDO81_022337 [Engystomops pustulosus]